MSHQDLIDTPCPSCASADRRFELRGRDPLSLDSFDIVRCLDCTLAYVWPRPTPEKQATYYPEDTYFAERHPVFKDEMMALRARKVGKAPSGGRLLDIGCGRGDFILACKKIGWTVVGAETPDAPIMQLRYDLGLDIIPDDALCDVPADSFDAITLWHVFEHIPDPRRLLKDVHRILKPNGRLLIEVPNFGSWHARISREAWYHLELPRHLLHFEYSTLAAILESEGFTARKWGTFSLEYDAFGLAQALLNRVCQTPNHLYQVLIGEPTQNRKMDTFLSFALLPPVALFAGIVSLIAPLFRRGGVLRVIAQKN